MAKMPSQDMAKKRVAPKIMYDRFPLPFDPRGKRILTLGDSVVITRELETALNGILGAEWRWTDLRLSLVSNASGVATYEVERKGNRVGQVKIGSIGRESPL